MFKNPSLPYSGIWSRIPSPLKIEIWTGLGILSDYPQFTPPPPIEIWTGLGILSFDYPSLPSPQKLKFEQDLAR